MKKMSVACVVLVIGLSTTAAFARGGMGHMMGPSHMSVTGGAFGTSATTPGTNSLGTALSSSGTGKVMKGELLGTSPTIDREEAKVEKIMGQSAAAADERRWNEGPQADRLSRWHTSV